MNNKVKSDQRVCAVVVSYYPNVLQLLNLLRSLDSQVITTVVVDNGTPFQTLDILKTSSEGLNVSWIALEGNFGVAKAQNIGIDYARTVGVDYVIIFDHDSAPPDNFVDDLLKISQQLILKDSQVAAIGPYFVDPRRVGRHYPFYQVKGLRMRRMTCELDGSFAVKTDVLISSGCLISMKALDVVGGMREELFIDYVDTEWSLRAKSLGYQCYGACDIEMKHELGDPPRTLFGKEFPMHSSLRHYYHFRNAIWLYQQNWIPLNWRLIDSYKLILKFVFYSLFTCNRIEHIKMMIVGIFHGINGRLGGFGSIHSND